MLERLPKVMARAEISNCTVYNLNCQQSGRIKMTTLIRLPELLARAGIGRSTVYKLIAEGKFPRPVLIGARAVGFVSEEVDDWIKSRIAARNEIFGCVAGRAASTSHRRAS